MPEIKLQVPDEPTVLDFQIAFKKQLELNLGTAMEEAFNAELEVANSQRIALHKRAIANRLQAQLEQVEKALAVLTEFVVADKKIETL